MNEPPNKMTFILLLVASAVCVADVWAGWEWTGRRQQLAVFRQQSQDSEALADKIDHLRQAPVKVEETTRAGDTFSKLVESVALEVGLASDRIVHVAPSEPRRIGDSPYLEQSTAVELREVTLRQLVEFSVALGRKEPRLAIPNVAVRIPPGDANPNKGRELWNVQMTLTAHVFAPKIPTPR
jgi:hypothetical protein